MHVCKVSTRSLDDRNNLSIASHTYSSVTLFVIGYIFKILKSLTPNVSHYQRKLSDDFEVPGNILKFMRMILLYLSCYFCMYVCV